MRLTLPSCNYRDKFLVYVDFSAYNIKQIRYPEQGPRVAGYSDFSTSDDNADNPFNPDKAALGSQAFEAALTGSYRGRISLGIELINSLENNEKADKWVKFKIVGEDFNGNLIETTAKVSLDCPKR